jgi:hypothetical protein
LVAHLPEHDQPDGDCEDGEIDRDGQHAIGGGIGAGVGKLALGIAAAGDDEDEDREDEGDEAKPWGAQRDPGRRWRGSLSRAVFGGFEGQLIFGHVGTLRGSKYKVKLKRRAYN